MPASMTTPRLSTACPRAAGTHHAPPASRPAADVAVDGPGECRHALGLPSRRIPHHATSARAHEEEHR